MIISAEKLTAIRADVDKAFAEIAKRHGLADLELGRITYDRNGAFRGTITGTDAGGQSKQEQRYNSLRNDYELPALGTRVRVGSKDFEIIGCNATGTKVLGKVASGAVYNIEIESVLRATKAVA